MPNESSSEAPCHKESIMDATCVKFNKRNFARSQYAAPVSRKG
jgi:hypothetical protein